eukprot:4590740-Prymnesium_polylepis.1
MDPRCVSAWRGVARNACPVHGWERGLHSVYYARHRAQTVLSSTGAMAPHFRVSCAVAVHRCAMKSARTTKIKPFSTERHSTEHDVALCSTHGH